MRTYSGSVASESSSSHDDVPPLTMKTTIEDSETGLDAELSRGQSSSQSPEMSEKIGDSEKVGSACLGGLGTGTASNQGGQPVRNGHYNDHGGGPHQAGIRQSKATAWPSKEKAST